MKNKNTIHLVTNVIKKNGSIDLPAQGASMFPLIQTDDLCRFNSCDPSFLKKGDIVLFQLSDEKLVAHRFYKSIFIDHQMYYLFKGDSNLGFDELIVKEQILGKLALILKKQKKIKARSLLVYIWGEMITSIPMISVLLHRYIILKNR